MSAASEDLRPGTFGCRIPIRAEMSNSDSPIPIAGNGRRAVVRAAHRPLHIIPNATTLNALKAVSTLLFFVNENPAAQPVLPPVYLSNERNSNGDYRFAYAVKPGKRSGL